MKIILFSFCFVVLTQCDPISEPKSEPELRKLAGELLEKTKFAKDKITEFDGLVRNCHTLLSRAKNYIYGYLFGNDIVIRVMKNFKHNVYKVQSVKNCNEALNTTVKQFADDLKRQFFDEYEKYLEETEQTVKGEIDELTNGSQAGDYCYDEEEEEESSSSAGYHTDESCSTTPEPSGKSLNCPDPGVERLRERYAALYSQASQHTLQALDGLHSFKDAPELKAKILYSIVVLSWRLAGILQASRRIEALKVLNGGNTHLQASAPPDLENCIRRQLATVGAQSGAREVAHQVTTQLERTLYDFPCLRDNAEVKKYALACSRLAWACLSRSTPLVLEVAQGQDFRAEVHVRHRSSAHGNKIKAVLWPGLRDGCQGPFLHKIVVVTS